MQEVAQLLAVKLETLFVYLSDACKVLDRSLF